MKIFYTVISKPEVSQSNPLLSLGGFKSSSPVPNSSFTSLFSDVSSYTIQKDLPEYIGLIIQNTFDRPVSDLKIYIPKQLGNFCAYRLSLVELSSEGEMEAIPTINSKPLYAEFYSTDIDDRIEVDGIMQPGEQMGLWVERTLDMTSDELVKSINCDYLYETKDVEKPTVEKVELKIDFEYA